MQCHFEKTPNEVCVGNVSGVHFIAGISGDVDVNPGISVLFNDSDLDGVMRAGKQEFEE